MHMKKASLQYTIRGVSERVDNALRETALQTGRSLNEAALRALEAGLGVSGEPVRYHDLDELAATWVKDKAVEDALKAQDRIDKELWT